MTTSPRAVSWRMYGLAFAIVLSPALLQDGGSGCAQPGDTTLSEFQFRVFSQDHINFDSDQRVYYVWLPGAADTADVVAYSTDTDAEVSYQYLDANEELIDAGWFSSFVGGGTMTLDGSLIQGRSIFRVYVKTAGTTFAKNYTVIIQVGCSDCDDGDACTDDSCDPVLDVCVHDRLCGLLFPCTEQGIRDAIAQGGGPHYFTCDGPTTVETNATIIIDKDVILDGEGLLTVDGQNDHRVFYVYPYTVALRGMTITQGGGDVTYGGGIRNEGTLTLTDVAVTDSTATGHGGAIYHHGPSMDLTRVTLTGNTANIGGAIAADSQGPLTITDSVLSDNHVSAFGGALRTSTTTTVNSSTFSHNMGLFGGAIMVYQDGALALNDSTVSGNRAQSGGGIYTYGELVLDGSVVSDNVVTHGGGGINQYEGTVAITNTAISGNSANSGGGIQTTAYSPATSSLTAINTTVSGNSAVYGGGLFAGGAASVAVAHLTVAGNTAVHEGSAVYGTDTATLTYKNNVIEGTCAAGSTTGNPSSGGYNIESPGDTCFLNHATDIPNVTPGNLGLGPLQDNGGPTLTHAPLSAASIAHNAVPATACTDLGDAPLLTDQRGFARPDGLDCDAGAVEGSCPDCSDGTLCSQDKCDPVLQGCSTSPVICPTDNIECTGDVCDPDTGLCNVTDGTLCASGVGLCMAGVCDLCAGVTCPDDGNECTVDDCDWATGACYRPRSDGSSCAGGAGQCVDGACDLCVNVTCSDDGNECTDDVCDPPTGSCGIPVQDGTPCDSGAGECVAGVCDRCVGVTCTPDGNECTDDTCDPATGQCNYPPATDGTACGSGVGECLNGECDLCPGLVCDPSVWSYEPCACEWTERMPTGQSGQGPMAYIAPGQCVQGLDVSLYDLDTNTWTPQSPANQPPQGGYWFEGYALAYLTDDQVLMFGGYDTYFDTYYDETWVYDLSENRWDQAFPTNSPPARRYAALAHLGNGKVLLFGGSGAAAGSYVWHQDTWVYDAGDQNWHLMNPTGGPPEGRVNHGMARLSDGRAILAGGEFLHYYGCFSTRTTWIYDLGDGPGGSWTQVDFTGSVSRTFVAQLGEDIAMMYGGVRFDYTPPDTCERFALDGVWAARPPNMMWDAGPQPWGPYPVEFHHGCETSLDNTSEIVVTGGTVWSGGEPSYIPFGTWTFGPVSSP